MKVSIKHLSITFMGNGDEPKAASDKPFYSQRERQLIDDLQRAKAANELWSRQMQAKRDQLQTAKSDNATYQRCNERQAATINELSEELAQIKAWCADYDKGEWPDHNAKGIGPVAVEVLAMMRDVWADIESRPLPKQPVMDWSIDANPVKRRMNPVKQCDPNERNPTLSDMIDAGYVQPPPQHPGYGCVSVALPESSQSDAKPDPPPLGQPAPETSQTQPAGPESPLPSGPADAIKQNRVYCMFGQCGSLAMPGENFCCGSFCDKAPATEAKAEQSSKPCKYKGCDEPRRLNSDFCANHRGLKPKTCVQERCYAVRTDNSSYCEFHDKHHNRKD